MEEAGRARTKRASCAEILPGVNRLLYPALPPTTAPLRSPTPRLDGETDGLIANICMVSLTRLQSPLLGRKKKKNGVAAGGDPEADQVLVLCCVVFANTAICVRSCSRPCLGCRALTKHDWMDVCFFNFFNFSSSKAKNARQVTHHFCPICTFASMCKARARK